MGLSLQLIKELQFESKEEKNWAGGRALRLVNHLLCAKHFIF